MIGYVYIFIVLLIIGLMFMVTNLLSSGGQGSYPYFAGTLSSALIVLVFAVPILTMKSIAEERRSKTDQMLLTYPVKVSSVILGKYFAMVTVYALPLAVSCLGPLVIAWESAGGGSFAIDYAAIFAFLCLGCLFVSIGMFISSLTESQIIAAVASMGAFLLLFFWSGLVGYIPETALATFIGFLLILAVLLIVLHSLTRSSLITGIAAVIGGGGLLACYLLDPSLLGGLLPKLLGLFSISETLGNFTSYYVFDVKGLIMYLSLSVLFVFLTIQSVQKRRWS
jgi:ABC-2 type transport system permease protein